MVIDSDDIRDCAVGAGFPSIHQTALILFLGFHGISGNPPDNSMGWLPYHLHFVDEGAEEFALRNYPKVITNHTVDRQA